MFLAKAYASRNANCAVGGQGWPVLPSAMAAQSPRAQSPGLPGTASVLSTTMPPRLSWLTGSDLSKGLGLVPAVHTSVSAGISPSFSTTTPGRASLKRAFSLNTTPRAAMLLCAYSGVNENDAQLFGAKIGVIGENAPSKVIQGARKLDAGKATAGDYEGEH